MQPFNLIYDPWYHGRMLIIFLMTSLLTRSLELGFLVRSHSKPDLHTVSTSRVKSKVNSCLSTNYSGLGLEAQPFFTRIGREPPVSSQFKQSWSSFQHRKLREFSLGDKIKPLVKYDPNHPRSRLKVEKLSDSVKKLSVIPQDNSMCNLSNLSSDFMTTQRQHYQNPSKQLRRKIRRIR